MKHTDLDAFDMKILGLLQRDNRVTAQAIADDVGLSPAACQKRLQRLRASGVIESEVAILSPKTVGLDLTAIVQVRISRDSAKELDQFKQLMLDAPEVTHCFYVTGENNFILTVVLPDMTAYEDFSRRYFIENTSVSHFVTSMVMDRIKTNGALHIAEDP